jgi:hypothetical protein
MVCPAIFLSLTCPNISSSLFCPTLARSPFWLYQDPVVTPTLKLIRHGHELHILRTSYTPHYVFYYHVHSREQQIALCAAPTDCGFSRHLTSPIRNWLFACNCQEGGWVCGRYVLCSSSTCVPLYSVLCRDIPACLVSTYLPT